MPVRTSGPWGTCQALSKDSKWFPPSLSVPRSEDYPPLCYNSHDDIEREPLKRYAEVVRFNLAFRATPPRRERGAGHANLDQWDFRYSIVGDDLQ